MLLSHVLDLQSKRGGWDGAHFFLALEALLAMPIAPATEAILAALPRLLELQRESGAFDDEGSEVRAYVGMRALALASDLQSSRSE